MLLHEPQQRPVANDPRLHALHQSRAQLAVWQRSQHADIGKHRPRLQKIPHEVFALGQIHAHLAAHARIHLRKESRRHLHIGNPAHEHRGHKSAHVAHNAAAKGNQQRSAIAASANHLPRQPLHALHRLVCSPGGRNSATGGSHRNDRRNFSLHRAQISGEVTTKIRRGSRFTTRSIRGASVSSNPLPAITSYFAEGVSTRIVCTVISF